MIYCSMNQRLAFTIYAHHSVRYERYWAICSAQKKQTPGKSHEEIHFSWAQCRILVDSPGRTSQIMATWIGSPPGTPCTSWTNKTAGGTRLHLWSAETMKHLAQTQTQYTVRICNNLQYIVIYCNILHTVSYQISCNNWYLSSLHPFPVPHHSRSWRHCQGLELHCPVARPSSGTCPRRPRSRSRSAADSTWCRGLRAHPQTSMHQEITRKSPQFWHTSVNLD